MTSLLVGMFMLMGDLPPEVKSPPDYYALTYVVFRDGEPVGWDTMIFPSETLCSAGKGVVTRTASEAELALYVECKRLPVPANPKPKFKKERDL